jgi:hypothetical protein
MRLLHAGSLMKNFSFKSAASCRQSSISCPLVSLQPRAMAQASCSSSAAFSSALLANRMSFDR